MYCMPDLNICMAQSWALLAAQIIRERPKWRDADLNNAWTDHSAPDLSEEVYQYLMLYRVGAWD